MLGISVVQVLLDQRGHFSQPTPLSLLSGRSICLLIPLPPSLAGALLKARSSFCLLHAIWLLWNNDYLTTGTQCMGSYLLTRWGAMNDISSFPPGRRQAWSSKDTELNIHRVIILYPWLPLTSFLLQENLKRVQSFSVMWWHLPTSVQSVNLSK